MKRRNNFLIGGLLLVMLVFLFSTVVLAAPDSFVITGIEDKDMKITVTELKELPVIEDEVTSVDSSGDENDYKIKGALFADLLAKNGIDNNNIKSLRFVAGDGYAIEVPETIINNRKIILAYEINGEPLYDKTKPVRAVIPGERSMYWVKNLVEIQVVNMVEIASIKELLFMETAFSKLEKYDYTYYESTDKAVKVKDFKNMTKFTTDSRTITMKAADGFNKDEVKDIFLNGYIKVTGEHAPMFLSPDIPKGMYVKDLLFVEYGNSTACSLQQALKIMPLMKIDGNEGIQLKELIAKAGVIKADEYKLAAVDGYEVTVSYNDLKSGIVYIDDKGRVRCSFAELSKKYYVKHFYKISAVE